jgi:hypothetical protein
VARVPLLTPLETVSQTSGRRGKTQLHQLVRSYVDLIGCRSSQLLDLVGRVELVGSAPIILTAQHFKTKDFQGSFDPDGAIRAPYYCLKSNSPRQRGLASYLLAKIPDDWNGLRMGLPISQMYNVVVTSIPY